MKKPILVFDVNETLLDLQPLDEKFKKYFHSSDVRKEWFNQLIESSFITIITDRYVPFGQVGAAALDMIAKIHKINLSEDGKKEILSTILNLPVHKDVVVGLKMLKKAGYILVSLTNSTLPVVTKQLTNAGISKYFDKMFSVDKVKYFKPAPQPYQMVVKHFSLVPEDCLLIASHAWDVAGAAKVGYKTAFIERPGKVVDPLAIPTDIFGKDLQEVAEKIIQTFP